MLQRANIIFSALYCTLKLNAVSKGLICNYFLSNGVKYLILFAALQSTSIESLSLWSFSVLCYLEAGCPFVLVWGVQVLKLSHEKVLLHRELPWGCFGVATIFEVYQFTLMATIRTCACIEWHMDTCTEPDYILCTLWGGVRYFGTTLTVLFPSNSCHPLMDFVMF